RLVVLFILAIPVSIALQCIYSATENSADVTGLGEQQKSCADSTKFCFTLDQAVNDTQIQQRGCSDDTLCSDIGTFDMPDLKGSVTCCTGDFCNPAAPVSLLIAVRTATAAACWV
ncbi:hypothetical protein PENTCL1PPCAC_13099, partial [Pristionchus entomophagus]